MVSKFTSQLLRVVLLTVILFYAPLAKAQTFVSGFLTADSTFTLAGSPYVITGNLVVTNGTTLTIESGVTLAFTSNTSLLVLGQLIASDPFGPGITFTANSFSPTPGFWGGISFGANATPATYSVANTYVSGSILNNVDIQYAGSSTSGVYGAIATTGLGQPYIRNARIINCAYPGIYSKSATSKIVISNCTVQNCAAGASNVNYLNNAAGINIRFSNSEVYIDSCEIGFNTGAGIAVVNTTGGAFTTIFNSNIHDNTNSLSANGGGIFTDARARIFFNLIYNNSATNGGGIASDIPALTGGKIYNNIFMNNTATEGAAFWGAIDSITNNVIAYHTGTNSIFKSYQKQYVNFNQFSNNTAPVIFNYYGGFTTAEINKNSFSGNNTASSTSALLKFDGTSPASVAQNNLMTNTGYSYLMQLINNNNTTVVPSENCFWKTTGTYNNAAIQGLIYDVLDDVNQGQLSVVPFSATPRTDCPISTVINPLKRIVGDSVIVYWPRKVGENVAGYKVNYGDFNGVFFAQVKNTLTDTFCKISVLENIDNISVSAYNTSAIDSDIDLITGAESWYTYANWDNAVNPDITSFTPTSATYGDSVIITGTNFTGATAVKFGGTNALSYTVTSSTRIKAIVNKGSSGNVLVQTGIGTATLSGFTYLAIPNITSFSPVSGGPGNTIQIRGFNFTGTSLVSFGGTNATSYTLVGDTLINAILGSGATGSVVVVNPFGSDTLAGFTFCSPFSLTLIDTNRTCGDSMFLAVNPIYTHYLWSTGDTTSSIYAKVGGSISVAVQTALGCIGRDTTFLILNPNPTPAITGLTSVCSGKSASYKTAKNLGRTYRWTVSGGAISFGQNTDSITVVWGAAGPGTLQVSDSVNATGCKTTTGLYNVTILANPSAPLITGEDTVCVSSFRGYRVPAASGHVFTWTVPGGAIQNGQGTDSIYVAWAGAATRIMLVVDSNSTTGCKSSSGSLSVLVAPNPTPVVTGNSSVCPLNTYTYSLTSIAGHSYTWSVSSNATIVSGQGTASIAVTFNTTLPTGTVQVLDSVRATTCKTLSSVFNVTVNTLPTPLVSGKDTVCAGTTHQYITPSNAGRSYRWIVGGGTIVSGQTNDTIVVTWPSAGNGILLVQDSVNTTGCKAFSPTDTIRVLANPTPIVFGKDSVCNGSQQVYQTAKNAGHSYTWSVLGGSILNQGADSINVIWTSLGSHNLIVKDSVLATGCFGIDTQVVVVLPTPTPTPAGPVSVCGGSSGTYSITSASGHTYRWTVVNGTILSGQGTSSISVSWLASFSSGSVQVLDSINATHCYALSAVVPVTINATPAPLVAGPTSVCANTASIYSVTKNTGRTYRWTVNGGTIVLGQGTDSITVSWGAAGLGSVQAIDSVNATGCKGSSSIGVTKNAIPAPVIVGEDTLCNGTTKIYTTTNTSGHTYTWLVTGGTISLGQGTSSVVVTWTAAGTGTLRVTDSINVAGCKGTSPTLNVLVNANPNPVISGLNSVCAGRITTYSIASGTGHTYNWVATGGGITAGNGTATVTITWGAAGAGSLVVTDSNNTTGCKGTSAGFNVTINPNPTPVITGKDTLCSGTSAIYNTPLNTGRTYFWTVTGGTIATGQGTSQVTINWGAAGTGTLTVKDSVTGGGCKTTTSPYKVVINNNSTPVISGAATVCASSTTSYSTPANTGRTYVWNVTGGTIASGQGTAAITVTWGALGSGSITVMDSVNGSGCKATSTPFAVTINANPIPVISGTNILCAGINTNYTTPANTGHYYTWTITGGTIINGQGTAALNVTWGGAGLGILTVMDSVIGGCSATTPDFLVSKIASPTPVITGSNSTCANSTATYSTPLNTGRVYTWSVSGGTIVSGQGSASITVLWGGIGTGTVVVIDSIETTGCKTVTVPFIVSIITNPTAIISGANVICTGATAMYGTINNPNRTFIWSAIGGTIVSANGTSSVNIQWGPAGTGTVYLVDSMNGSGCTASTFRNVTVNPLPTAYFDAVLMGGGVTCIPAQTGLSYKWYFGDGDSSTYGRPNHFYAANGTYTVTLHATSPAGCVKDSSMDINMNSVGIEEVFGNASKLRAYPNPFQGTCTISFQLLQASNVSIEVFDMSGRLVETMQENTELKAGKAEYVFDAKSSQTSAGIYIVKVKINDQTQFLRIAETVAP
ncbi:MAG: hypothetical protein CFE21_09150 [Bacteroidetes bacterium B1(2017)]|nr:MAG: hypothetical protein CFE21_09150 [Bacteroidetes bacterium B1(2017)]